MVALEVSSDLLNRRNNECRKRLDFSLQYFASLVFAVEMTLFVFCGYGGRMRRPRRTLPIQSV